MSFRAVHIGIASFVILGIGLYLMSMSVYLDEFDRYGMQIPCGTAYGVHLDQAIAAGDQYIGKCDSAVLMRRLWTIPVVAVGALGLLAVLVRAATSSAHETLMPTRDTH